MKKYAAHQQRVIDEMIQLNEKISLLQAFVKTSEIYKALPESERDLLLQQRTAMRAYSAILNQRIALFTPVEVEDTEQEESPAVPLAPLFRAKFKVLQVIPEAHGNEVVVMDAVTDGTPEDNSFSKWTPAAELTIAVTNPDLFGAISPLDKFYVDFTLAEKAAVVESDTNEHGIGPDTDGGSNPDFAGDDQQGDSEQEQEQEQEQEETPEEA